MSAMTYTIGKSMTRVQMPGTGSMLLMVAGCKSGRRYLKLRKLGEKGIAGKPVSAKAGFDRAGEESA